MKFNRPNKIKPNQGREDVHFHVTEGAIINVTFLSTEVVSKEREGVRDRGQRRELKMEKSSQQDGKKMDQSIWQQGRGTGLGTFRRLNKRKERWVKGVYASNSFL